MGTQDGRWPAMGFHIRGEMGGVWTPPLKLLDGIWFSIDGQPIGPATRFTSGWGYAEMDLPDTAGLQARRVEFAPDGRRAVLIGLRLSSAGAAREVEVGVDAHSELMLEGRTIDRSMLERPMVLQAWGAYGTAWPVVHQQLGVHPDLGRRRLEVVPQLPRGQRRMTGGGIRMGGGTTSVTVTRRGGKHRTVVITTVRRLRRLTLGHTLGRGARIDRVLLDGRRVRPRLRLTNRGLEVTARVRGGLGGRHVLTVRTGRGV